LAPASTPPGFGKVDKDLTDATIGDKHLVAGLGWVLGR
jgi:hypothetical protein